MAVCFVYMKKRDKVLQCGGTEAPLYLIKTIKSPPDQQSQALMAQTQIALSMTLSAPCAS